jgi:hypothetical protein
VAADGNPSLAAAAAAAAADVADAVASLTSTVTSRFNSTALQFPPEFRLRPRTETGLPQSSSGATEYDGGLAGGWRPNLRVAFSYYWIAVTVTGVRYSCFGRVCGR